MPKYYLYITPTKIILHPLTLKAAAHRLTLVQLQKLQKRYAVVLSETIEADSHGLWCDVYVRL